MTAHSLISTARQVNMFPVPVIDHFFSVGWMRKAIWKVWYPLLTRRLHGEEVLFLNYAYEENPAMNIPLAPDDEPNRACIQLYHHVATQVDLRGKNVLEVSCGHGGGASYLARTFQPKNYTALDLNPAGIKFCEQRHHVDGLNFVQGDAENLPFEPNTFDAVINVEASHCYPNFPRFLAEVARVLRPGGHFLYADFRFADRQAEWEKAIAAAPLKILHMRSINAQVRRGMNRNSARSQDLVARHLPKFMHSLGADFAGIKGSRIHNALTSGELSYRSYCFEKPGANDQPPG
jgi:ubiquinone/menaquinone biosynthesis C-methylase UbiE